MSLLSTLNHTGLELWDFRVFWTAGGEVLHGNSPYPPPTVEAVATERSFVYPPVAAYVFAPLGALPYELAAAIYLPLLLASIAAGLWVLGVRDWRCFAIAYACVWTLNATLNGALGPFLFLVLALAWRHRHRPYVLGTLVALLSASKLFLWPLLIWLAAMRRFRALAVSVGLGTGLILGSWAALGFAGITDYPRVLQLLAETLQAKSFSTIALGLTLGLPEAGARSLALLLGGALLLLALVRGRRAEMDALVITFAVAAAIVMSPIVWRHYFVLLLLPVALASPRFSPVWLALLLTRFVPGGQADGDIEVLAPTYAVAAIVLGWSAYLIIRATRNCEEVDARESPRARHRPIRVRAFEVKLRGSRAAPDFDGAL